MVDFQKQIPQHLVDRCKHMNGQKNQWMIRLNFF